MKILKNKMEKKKVVFLIVALAVCVFGMGEVSSVEWDTTEHFYGNEDLFYEYNVSKNVSNVNGSLIIGVDTTNNNITWDNGTQEFFYKELSNLSWFEYNSTDFILDINSTNDNETGEFGIPFQASDDNTTGTTEILSFILNATNDKPDFTRIRDVYNFSGSYENNTYFLNASDEEEQYPLDFNISWEKNCTHASWTGRNTGENCSLSDFGFNLTNIPNKSAVINYTPEHNEVGTYWANITSTDYGENDTCPHQYCDNSTYEENKTKTYSVKFNVFSSLYVNVSDCNNTEKTEGENLVCNISVRTSGEEDLLNFSSYSYTKDPAHNSNVSNRSWFYPDTQANSSNYTKEIEVNISLDDYKVGNWSINFSVFDISFEENITEKIELFVNNSEDNVNMESISDRGKIYENETFYFNASDDDLLVPDKSVKNESLTFDSNVSWVSFNKERIIENKTEKRIKINYDELINKSGEGNYSVKVNVTDDEGSSIENEIFSLEALEDNAPVWNKSKKYNFSLQEENSSWGGINLSEYVNDSDSEDNISFYYFNDTKFPSLTSDNFNSTTGVVNFTPDDGDVGFHNITVIASDSKLNSTEYITFNISNVNDEPLIKKLEGDNASISGSEVNVTEDNRTKFTLWAEDDDLKINQKDYCDDCDENLSLDLTILNSTGSEVDLFSFSKDSSYPTGSGKWANASKYDAIFTPNKSDVGNYSFIINITDKNSVSDVNEFNLTVQSTEHSPVLSNLTNQYSAVNRSFYYDINATDLEEINESVGNLTFFYSVTSGNDVLNSSTFNSSTGEINITFNSSHSGKYSLNVSVNDSSNNTDSESFWIYVYDIPEINSPGKFYNFTGLVENQTGSFEFNASHVVADNLTYEFSLDRITPDYSCLNESNTSTCSYNFSYSNFTLRENTSYYGNKSNFSWEFTPDFKDETYGLYKNLSLTVYPSNSNLTDAEDLNFSRTWDLNVSHKNHPISFSGNIDNRTVNGKETSIDLKQYFTDYDWEDSYYEQNVSYNITTENFAGSTSVSSDWILNINSGATGVTSTFTIQGRDFNLTGNNSLSNASSNTFEIEFTEPEKKETPTSSTTTEVEVPVSFKLLFPSAISGYKNEVITVPITLYNDGERDMSNINLSGLMTKNGSLDSSAEMSFDKSFFESLESGEKENTTLNIFANTNETGIYEVTLNASVETPEYSDWGKMYLTIKEKNMSEIKEKLLFTEEFLMENPVCAEYMDILEQAKSSYEEGDVKTAKEKVSDALNACKEALRKRKPPEEESLLKQSKLMNYTIGFIGLVILLSIAYYVYKRIKIK